MATLYIETSVVSYLTALPSSQVVTLSRQMLTKRWWDGGRLEHELFTSQFVVDEATQGASEPSRKRLTVLSEIPLLDVLPEVFDLADDLLAQSILPAMARLDAQENCKVFFFELWPYSHRREAHQGGSFPGRSLSDAY